MKEEIREILLQSGAVAVGFAKVHGVEPEVVRRFDDWIAAGDHAGMEYMANHRDLRIDPGLLLENAQTVISLAFSFVPPQRRDDKGGMIASYAYNRDYHDVLRKRLKKSVRILREKFGGEYRICIDSAPVMERYWAVKAGVGKRGVNGAVIVPGAGSLCFLVEILTTLSLPPDEESKGNCLRCGSCVRACPGRAIGKDGRIDSRRCLSYLTIEHRGKFTDPDAMAVMDTPAGKNVIFGCDLCLRVCPHNRDLPPSRIEEFHLSPLIRNLDKDTILSLDNEAFKEIFRGSPLRRSSLEGLLRNIEAGARE